MSRSLLPADYVGKIKSLFCKGGNTWNLFSHLQHHHLMEFAAMQELGGNKGTGEEVVLPKATTSRQLGLSEIVKYPHSGKRWRTVADTVLCYTC